MRDTKDMPYWQRRFLGEVLKKPGVHCLGQGHTGGGKTNLLHWIVSGFLNLRDELPAHDWETLVWFDRGKSSEILKLCRTAQVRFLIPEGCDIELVLFDDATICDYEKKYFSNPAEIWDLLDRDRINIICLQRFLMDPEAFPPVVAKLFKSLILKSFNYSIHPENCAPSILLPRITLIIDEINNIAPSKGQGTGSKDEANAGAWIQQNIEQLRSQNIRLIGTTHGWRKLRPGVRSSFQTHIALPGAYYPSSEKPKLARFNILFEKLETGQCCMIFEKDIFSDPFKVPWLGKGSDLGYILYHGQMKKAKRQPKQQISTQALLSALTQLSQQQGEIQN
ncbi:hypothetical protein ACSAZL_12435 [Methanosarcina sp. T3]|uniref:hypothetical protein n=1 Tax=Methanosarcina sp. T3 TaxID=3439062 RepID=UPI003F87B6F1